MTITQTALDALAEGPKTSAQLGDILQTHGGDIGNLMARLIKQGKVERLNIERIGKRTVATYALRAAYMREYGTDAQAAAQAGEAFK